MVTNLDKIKWQKNHFKERYKKGGIKIDIFMFSIIIIISMILLPLSSINIVVPITLVSILIFNKYRWDKKIRLNCPSKIGISNKGLFLNYETHKKRISWEDVKDIKIDDDRFIKIWIIEFRNGSKYPLVYLTNDLIKKFLKNFENYKKVKNY